MTSAETRETVQGLADEVWRPIQYLGSKLRSLGSVAMAVDSVCDPGATVWDPFTGSSVVAQAVAATGRRVIAHDTQHAAATFASALLGVGRVDSTDPPWSVAERLWNRLVEAEKASSQKHSFWDPWLIEEDEAVAAADAHGLVEMSTRLPQRWKDEPSSDQSGPPSQGPGIAATFAGTYFGLRQTLRLDALRLALQQLQSVHAISRWERDVLLTGLCHAASAAVFSAGKHFAQPLRATDGNMAFAYERMLQDRSFDIDDLARAGVLQAVAAARQGHEGHHAAQQDVLEVGSAYLTSEGVRCVYADPPYTAQQYSRFYHILETLVKGVAEPLQVWRGQVTRGLYPRDRYLSPFSSVTGAPDAFRGFFATVAEADAALVLSYSASVGVNSGNARMVDLEDLKAWLGDVYGRRNVEMFRFNHVYRQFNSSEAAMADRNEPEYLLTAVPG